MIKTLHSFRTLSILSMSLLWIAGCSPKHAPQLADPVVSGLAVAQVTVQQVPASSGAVGTVHAKESAVLSAQVTGRVFSVLVHEGDTVRAGQTLVRLDDSLARADVDRTRAIVSAAQHQVELAKTQYDLAASTLARFRVLRDTKSVSPQEFDEVDRRAQAAATQLEAAESQLDAAKAEGAGAHIMAGYSIIAAPFAGMITARHVDPGALATPGTPLLELERGGELQLQVTLDESLLHNLKIGDAIDANVPSAASQAFRGRVAEIVPAADPASHTFLIKIELPTSSRLRSGMYGTAAIQGSARPAFLIPQAAVLAHGSLNSVWVLDSNHVASIRYVTLGNRVGQKVEALSGLSSGETLVLSAGDRELAGCRIEARP